MRKRIIIRSIGILIILVLSFAGLAIAEGEIVEGQLAGGKIFSKKCSKCHSIDRPKGKNKSKEGWEMTAKRMQSKDKEWLTDDDVKEIVTYLSAKSLFENKCSICHGIDRPLSKKKSMAGWELTVKRMSKKRSMKAPNEISDEEAKQIVGYLFTERSL